MKQDNNDIITSDEVLGKEAVDPDGSIIGVVTSMHVNKRTKELVGITIDLGFLKPDLFVGMDYIKHFGVDAVLLNKTPLDKFKGLIVLSFEGKEIGIVKKVTLHRRRMKELIVTLKSSGLMKKEVVVASKDIKQIGSGIILKKNASLKPNKAL